MSWKNPPTFHGGPTSEEREELRKLCEERDKKLKLGQMPTIVTDQEMADRRRLKMNCTDYVTLSDFKKRVAMTNQNFILRRKTLQQELDDKKLFEEVDSKGSEKQVFQ